MILLQAVNVALCHVCSIDAFDSDSITASTQYKTQGHLAKTFSLAQFLLHCIALPLKSTTAESGQCCFLEKAEAGYHFALYRRGSCHL